ncbi:MAG: IMP dehydrogenase, partial [Nitrospinaceae bacterium]|nr:IMP dehydrogenase [Nitrospinaceae bacterium]
MPLFIGRNREARRAYGFDEVALVPGTVTVNPDEVNITRRLAEGLMLEIPFLASAMDGVVDMKFAGAFGKLGGLGVLNLEGIYTRYENPYPELQRIIEAPNDSVTHQIQEVYREPIKDFLIGQRVTEMKKSGAYTAVSAIPQKAKRYGQIAQEAGADVLVVQSTVT